MQLNQGAAKKFQTRDLPPTPSSSAQFIAARFIRGARSRETGRKADASILAALSVLACAPQPTVPTAFRRIAATGHRCWNCASAKLAGWWRRARSRRELLTLGPIELADLRLTRTDARIEAGKWFWRQ